MAIDSAAGEWCGPTRELENTQLASLVHKTRKVITTADLHVDIEVANANEDDVVLLVNKPPAAIGTQVDALPEAVVLDPAELFDEVICDVEPVIVPEVPHRAGSSSTYPMHRDTLRPVRIVIVLALLAMIGAGTTVAALFV